MAAPESRGEGRIGPNAVTRLAEALVHDRGAEACRRVFEAADAAPLLDAAPTEMVDDEVVARLHAALRDLIGGDAAARIAADAGRRTADYLVDIRIPAAARRLLPLLPPGLAVRLLFRAIGAHAWTFAGRGRFDWAAAGGRVTFRLAGAPVARGARAPRPACGYYAATFARLLSQVARAPVSVEETACEACGAPACRFEVTVGRRDRSARAPRDVPRCQKVSGGGGAV